MREMAMWRPIANEISTFDFLSLVPGVEVFGFLLCSSADDSLSKMIQARWLDLHHLTGDKFVLVAFQTPEGVEDQFKAYWKKRLGSAFTRAWKDWKKLSGEGVAYDYLQHFQPSLKPSQLPCLVLCTDLTERRAVIRPMPDWSTDELYHLFVGFVETIHESYDVPKEERLDFLARALTAPTARTSAYLGYIQRRAVAYMKKNPAKVAV